MERPGGVNLRRSPSRTRAQPKIESFGSYKGRLNLRGLRRPRARIEALLGLMMGPTGTHLCALPSAWRRRFLATQRGMWGTCLEGCHLLICIQYLG